MLRDQGRILILESPGERGVAVELVRALGGPGPTAYQVVTSEGELAAELARGTAVAVIVHDPVALDALAILFRLRAAGVNAPVLVVHRETGELRRAMLFCSDAMEPRWEQGATGRGLRRLIGRAIRCGNQDGEAACSGAVGAEAGACACGRARDITWWCEDGHGVELLRSLAHELRNSLGTIANGLEVLTFQGTGNSLTQRRTVDLMGRQCRHMSNVLEGAMEIARLSQGSIVMTMELVQLDDLVTRVLNSLRAELDERGLSVTTELPEPRPWLEVDFDRISRALRHVVSSVMRQVRSPGTLVLRAQVRDDGVHLWIGPNGPADGTRPLPEEVDQPGRQERASLDLILARCLLDQHGGRLDRGRQWQSVQLPCVPRPMAESAERPNRTKCSELVIVDKDPCSARTLCGLLQRAGYRVRLCHSAADLRRAVEAHHADAVLVGLELDVCELGPIGELLAPLREASGLKVIGMGPALAETEEVAGFDGLLPRPFQLDDLARALTRIPGEPLA